MQFLVIYHPVDKFADEGPPADFAEVEGREEVRLQELYAAGSARQVWALDTATHGAAVVYEADSAQELEKINASYPLIQAGYALTHGEGVDVSINSVGADTLDRDASILRAEGQLVVSGMAAGLGTVEPLKYGNSLTVKEFQSCTHFGRPEDVGATDTVDHELQDPSHLDEIERFALDDVVEAHRPLEAGTNFGKIVLFP